MIPIKLTLKNFMSYGEEGATLPFEGLHVACLSGDNGNGKSALLDAMTWALWGKTRASGVGSTTEDDLIRLGTDEMEVRFEFELNAQRYRVVRKRRRGKSSDWQLAQSDEDGGWVAAGGGGVKEVGRQIVQLLNMEYDTFLNSAYLQQGRADEFTRQLPSNRKRILGEILGLDRYDHLEARAKDLARERREIADELEREKRLLDAEAARKPEHEAQVEETRRALSEKAERVAVQERETAKLREERHKLDAVAHTVEEAERLFVRAETGLEQRRRELCDRLGQLKTLQDMLDQKEAILKDYAVLQEAQRRRELLEPQVQTYNETNTELQNVVGAIDIAKTKLEGELRLLESQVRESERRRQEIARLDTRIAALARELKAEAQCEQTLAAARQELQQADDVFTELRARNERLKLELRDVDDVLELLSHPQAACPVCESALSGRRHEEVRAKQRAKRERLLSEQEAVTKEARSCRQALNAAQTTVTELEARRNALAFQRSQHQEFIERRDGLRAEDADAEDIRRQFAARQAQRERGEYAAPQQARRQRLEKELERLGLAKTEFEAVSQSLRNLQSATQRHQALQRAEESWAKEIADKKRLESLVAEKEKECAEHREKWDRLKASLSQYEAVKAQLAVAENELGRLQSEVHDLRVRETSCLHYIERCERAQADSQRRAAEHKKVDEERRIYSALAQAFSKKGVQALIIENVLPELEDDANDLLARITDNALSVRFETVRAAKSTGADIETLDIRITDDAGVRPYELFSGGEAFRVNFAIRIALSRLLARRSGARLQTLVLDEGFGTQDGKGREKLIEVIEVIKDDFEKILVITHVEELKDSFAQRIEIVKDAGGSRIHLL
jgi:exonuclease SbcC